ncbi:F-box/LRR-repeat protein 7-like [Mercenaria mercenaria]|uniref:F-box/LRR-repeat protein 7-like n=1 Tax=Mercenaria mercenaria TaxID=6596 RepID=UPI00234E58B4|nr:F-box/LRR-repeat protein 7-like [Mercenaria mercenaria]
MAAARLPVEVVSHIMGFLSVSDRKDAALVCRSWYEASLDPILQRDIIIHFYASSAEQTTRAIPSLSRRRLPHLVLNNFDLSLDAKAVLLKSCEHLSANLRSLSLKGSNITERTFVELLSKCTNLVTLDLSCCNSLFMSGTLLEKNSDMQLLKASLTNVLDVNLASIRYMSDATFNRIMTVCENVEKLSLAGSQMAFSSNIYYPDRSSRIASSSVLTFKNFLDFMITQPCLTSLNLSKTQIEDEHLEELVVVSGLKLQELILIGCRNVSDEGIAYICKHQPQLKSLDIRECPDLTNSTVLTVSAGLSQLRNLYLNKCKQITDKAAMSLSRLNQLEVLDMSECFQVTSAGLVRGLCKEEVTAVLTHLNLNCCSLVGDSFVEKACECLPLLTHLDLGSCFKISDNSVHSISSSLKYLRFLRLAWCKEVTDLGLLGLLTEGNQHKHDEADGECRCTRKYASTVIFKKPTIKKNEPTIDDIRKNSLNSKKVPVAISNIVGLKYLDLTACKKLTDTSLMQVIKFPEIRVLSLGMLPELSPDGVAQIVRNNPSIEELNLSQCGSLTDSTMATITTRLPRLQMLNVFGCDKLTDKSVNYIKDNCSRLKHLDVSFCGGLSHEAVENLENKSKTLQTIQKRMIGSA